MDGSDGASPLGKVEEMVRGYVGRFPGVRCYPTRDLVEVINRKMTVQQAQHQSAADVIIVDVREEAEMNVSVLPLAVTKTDFERDHLSNASRDTLIVVYCTVGYRSAMYVQELQEKHNFTNAHTGEGVLAWTYHVDYLVDKKTGDKTSRVHTFNSTWDYASPRYSTVQYTSWDSFVAAIRTYFRGS